MKVYSPLVNNSSDSGVYWRHAILEVLKCLNLQLGEDPREAPHLPKIVPQLLLGRVDVPATVQD